MYKPKGILSKLRRAFILQAAFISIAVLLSVFIASLVIDEILIKSAIEQEADYYWQQKQLNQDFNLPNTSNLEGFASAAKLMEKFNIDADKAPGFYDHIVEDKHLVLHISETDNKKLFLIYNRGQVDTLAAYYGLFPLSIVLIFLYLILFFTYKFSRRTISPISLLAREVNKIDFKQTLLPKFEINKEDFSSDQEIEVLSDAIIHLGERLQAFISRERNFTRDASHEIRSPLTVINIAADMLLSEQELSKPAKSSIERIKRATADMLELTEAFLLLARESDSQLSNDTVNINDVIKEEIERVDLINNEKPIEIICSEKQTLYVNASDKVLSVLLGNLIRNAITYTEQGTIEIIIKQHSVSVKDSGKGIEQAQLNQIFKPYYRGENNNKPGHGVGLTIVKRLSDRFNWPINFSSQPGKGTTVEVSFESAISNPRREKQI